MKPLSAWRSGLAFAITVSLLYIACAIATLAAPSAIASVIDTVVHGLNIGPLTRDLPPAQVSAMATGLVYVTLYSFVAGTLYSAVRNLLAKPA
jgi:hypothetical protein